ncbi:hypothetical protein BX600DRAFT_435095 [Xylariales sp. PMI_506]|nr:hypothetical protein BX600DRAFT_435095 [Xylariales sp. PMI_506]
MTPPIAIIGGGPSGLTFARLLECKGIDYVIYERDESESVFRTGGSLDLHLETGQRALKECGLFEEFKKYARWEDGIMIFSDMNGKPLIELGQERDLPEIDRGDLRGLLLESIPKAKIRWGHALKSAILGDDGSPIFEFVNGLKVSGFKLIVGADGVWSRVRSLVTDAKPQYYGAHYIESRLSHGNPVFEVIAKLVPRGTWIGVGSSKAFMIQKQRDGHYRINYGILVPEDFSRSGAVDLSNLESTRALFLSSKFYADWADNFKDFIRNSTDYFSWPLYHFPTEKLHWKSVPGVTIIGDAAHCTTPFAGEGANCAMADALALATKIAEYGIEDMDRAVREYEAEMFPRGVDLITRSAANGELLYNTAGPGDLVQALQGGSLLDGKN